MAFLLHQKHRLLFLSFMAKLFGAPGCLAYSVRVYELDHFAAKLIFSRPRSTSRKVCSESDGPKNAADSSVFSLPSLVAVVTPPAARSSTCTAPRIKPRALAWRLWPVPTSTHRRHAASRNGDGTHQSWKESRDRGNGGGGPRGRQAGPTRFLVASARPC